MLGKQNNLKGKEPLMLSSARVAAPIAPKGTREVPRELRPENLNNIPNQLQTSQSR